MTTKTVQTSSETICEVCKGNHFITLYEHVLKEKPREIKSLYSNPINFINCPSCVDNLKNDF